MRVINGLQRVDFNRLSLWVVADSLHYWPFERGEVIILEGDEYGREPFGEGRKPAKWDVELRPADSLDEAIEIHYEILASEDIYAKKRCPKCNGTGNGMRGIRPWECGRCGGKGIIE